MPSIAMGLTVSGNHVYVADGDSGLQIIDTSNPGSPEIVGSADTPGRAYDVSVSGDHAYLCGGYPGLCVIDISLPDTPVIIGTVITTGTAESIAISQAGVFLATEGIYVHLEVAYLQCED